MLKCLRLLPFCLFFLATFSSTYGQVVISEFMADNATGYQDEDKDRSDWIEVFNAGSSAVNLGGWFLTDDSAALSKWQFPSTNLNGGAYLMVIASGKKI